jgi:hypothetical protein
MMRDGLRAEEFEVAIAGNAASAKVVLDDEHWNGGVFGNNHRPDDARLGEHDVIALDADANKALGFEDLHQLLIRNRAKLWHASAEAGGSHAAR